MNQILVSQKIYVTPELRRKKRFYKLEFFLSVFLLCVLASFYIYAEYDKTKSEEVGKMMLNSITEVNNVASYNEELKLSEEEYKVWTFVLENTNGSVEEVITPEEPIDIKDEQVLLHQETYYDSKGEPYTIIATISIPKINIEYAVLSRTSDELLKINPTKFEGYEKSPNPNEVGNLCIVGHNYLNSRFFSKVPTLELGDTMNLTDNYGETITYYLYDKYMVDPTDISCLEQNTNGKKEVTLITCNNNGSKRVIAKFREKVN